MNRLLKYTAVIYDANCIIYYCFKSGIGPKNRPIVIDSRPFTDKIREITKVLRERQKNVLTLQLIFDEITQTLLAKVVDEKLYEISHLLRRVNIDYESNAYLVLRKKLLKKINQKVQRLRYGEEWFSIDSQFQPNTQEIADMGMLYQRMLRDPAKQSKFLPRKRRIPSKKDLSLALFSKGKQLPLISNDSDLYNFNSELKDNGYCYEIYGLMKIQTA